MLNTLRNKLLLKRLNRQSRRSARSTKMILQLLRGALIGSLMICVAMVSACSSNLKVLSDNSQITVDAHLMREPNLTTNLLSVLSE